MYSLALAFGMDAREIWPATASGATKADATIQHQKAIGKGWGDLITTLERGFNWSVLPEGVELEFDNQDDEQDRLVAEMHGIQIDNVSKMVLAGNVTAQEGRAILISQNVIDPAVLQSVTAPVLADDSAPVTLEEGIAAEPPATPAEPAPSPVLDTQGRLLSKELGRYSALPTSHATKETPATEPAPEPAADKSPPVIKGEPLPEKEATKVEPFTEAEINDLFDTYAKLKGKVKGDA